ncbi:MAG: amidohydrolase [Caulobacteraceae bacterium]|nr:amidohydrolase [Caulobacteraceae bacterium]
MLKSLCPAGLVGLASLALAAPALAAAEGQAPVPLIAIYKAIHAHPELSHFEEQTSAVLAGELRAAGYAVTDHIGVYSDGSRAFGVVGILKNGPGPTLLIRADMDALPIVEETGLPYASHLTAKTRSGQEVGVMHACGHDVHTTVLIGVARALAAGRSRWHGTLMLVGQPSEETVDGARAMLADHLYERFGRPDMVVGLHDSNAWPAGKVGLAIGPAQAGVTSVDVTIRGIGSHGAAPQMGKDPVVLSALFITQLQTIVSREEDPQDPAIVTVGSIHGGTKRNIIPDQVRLELTTRAFSDHGRQVILDGIRQMAQGVAISAGLPPDRAPIVTVVDAESAPPLYNDPVLSARVRAALIGALGQGNVIDAKPVTPSEDVGNFGLDGHQIPVTYYWLGAMNPEKFQAAASAGRQLPGPHNSRFEPDPEPTLAAGVRSMTAVAETLLQ